LIHDAFQGLPYWKGFMTPSQGYQGVAMDIHHYQIFSNDVCFIYASRISNLVDRSLLIHRKLLGPTNNTSAQLAATGKTSLISTCGSSSVNGLLPRPIVVRREITVGIHLATTVNCHH